MTDAIRKPEPITPADREFIADVEETLRPAYLNAIAEEFGPKDRPAADMLQEMTAAAPGQRLQTAIAARMNSSRLFDGLPADERTAYAERAALAAATSLNGKLTVETADSRLGRMAGRGADRLLSSQYASLAHTAGSEVGLVLGGAINRIRFVHQLKDVDDVQRQATSGLTPPGTGRPGSATSATTTAATTRAVDRNSQPRTLG
ncbi:hypothetical protein [Kribbella sp. NPDC004536]|uniref:hypothetical protein n=1 Tax=Kribbella sp. NPDC004536 TaxID=3364106 RepID=UPI0036B94948